MFIYLILLKAWEGVRLAADQRDIATFHTPGVRAAAA
jgi:hypothetical protein